MLKAVLKYLLTLCILLLSVYSNLYAQAYQENTFYASIKQPKGAELSSHGTLRNDETLHLRFSLADPEKSLRLEATDIEEEENKFLSLKKLLERSLYFTAALFSVILAYFFRSIKTGLLSCKQFSYTLSQRRYLLFQVFRI